MNPTIRDGAVWYGAGGNPGFVYTINGGPFPDNPAETLLGYTPAPGGRWNVFADGHVAWAPDP